MCPNSVESDAMEQIRKTGIAAHGIKPRVHFKKLQNV
jgi:hypothetical protein